MPCRFVSTNQPSAPITMHYSAVLLLVLSAVLFTFTTCDGMDPTIQWNFLRPLDIDRGGGSRIMQRHSCLRGTPTVMYQTVRNNMATHIIHQRSHCHVQVFRNVEWQLHALGEERSPRVEVATLPLEEEGGSPTILVCGDMCMTRTTELAPPPPIVRRQILIFETMTPGES